MEKTLEEQKKEIDEMELEIKDIKLCPLCQKLKTDVPGYLQERESEHGLFYGCSNYPACRFTTQKIN